MMRRRYGAIGCIVLGELLESRDPLSCALIAWKACGPVGKSIVRCVISYGTVTGAGESMVRRMDTMKTSAPWN
jgi:hypothetical protein